MKFTIERRTNKKGEVIYRVITMIKGRVIDGYGKTPENAHGALVAKLALMVTLIKSK